MNPNLKHILLSNIQYYTMKRCLHKYACRFLPRLKGRVLDVGAGKKQYQVYLHPDVEYITIDILSAPRPKIVCDARALAFTANSFDSAMCMEVLEHVPEPLAALLDINRVLKPGGQLYLTTPMTWGLHYVPFDFYRFTKYGLEHLLNRSGFQLLDAVAISGLFTMILARLEDIGMTLVYRAFFPLKLIMENQTRARVVSALFFPFVFLFDVLASFLDAVIPRAKEDALGWAVFAVKKEEFNNLRN